MGVEKGVVLGEWLSERGGKTRGELGQMGKRGKRPNKRNSYNRA